MNHGSRWWTGCLWLGAGLIAGVAPLSAQSPAHRMVLSGYGTTQYTGSLGDTFENGFSTSVSPVILWSLGSDFLFETEVEFELEEGATHTGLEYAQVDYLGLESVQVIAGKFLLPFGVFGERIHPTWINKLPTMPVVFGHAEGGVAHGSLLPILSDVGAMVRWAQPFGSGWMLDVSGYVTQGPSIAEPEEEGGEVPMEGEMESPAPPVAWGVAFDDNNQNKMVGGRVGFVKGPSFEAYASAFHARYDPEGVLDVVGGALSAEWRRGPLQLRAEGVLLSQDFEDEAGAFQTLDRSGLYVEASRRMGAWELVGRWSHLGEATVDSNAVLEAGDTFALGIDYWFEPMIPLKVAWVTTDGSDDHLMVQWAFGF